MQVSVATMLAIILLWQTGCDEMAASSTSAKPTPPPTTTTPPAPTTITTPPAPTTITTSPAPTTTTSPPTTTTSPPATTTTSPPATTTTSPPTTTTSPPPATTTTSPPATTTTSPPATTTTPPPATTTTSPPAPPTTASYTTKTTPASTTTRPIPRDCPAHWRRRDYTDRCYRIIETPLTWFGAAKYCNLLVPNKPGVSHLVSIEDFQEQYWLYNMMLKNNTDNYWTSGNSIDERKGFTWAATSQPFQFTQWATGEPDGSGSCVHIWNDHKYRWDDTPCEDKLGFICEASMYDFN